MFGVELEGVLPLALPLKKLKLFRACPTALLPKASKRYRALRPAARILLGPAAIAFGLPLKGTASHRSRSTTF